MDTLNNTLPRRLVNKKPALLGKSRGPASFQLRKARARASQASRPITDAEVSVIERALAAAEIDTDSLLPSVRSLLVVGHCGCGCASVDFAVPASTSERAVSLVDAMGRSVDGEDLGIIIWTRGGHISGLEVFGYTNEPAPLPVVSSVKACPWH